MGSTREPSIRRDLNYLIETMQARLDLLRDLASRDSKYSTMHTAVDNIRHAATTACSLLLSTRGLDNWS